MQQQTCSQYHYLTCLVTEVLTIITLQNNNNSYYYKYNNNNSDSDQDLNNKDNHNIIGIYHSIHVYN